MEKKDIVIAALELARSRSLVGQSTSPAQMSALLVQAGLIDGANNNMQQFIQMLSYDSICTVRPANTQNTFIGLDAYMALLDHEELQLARQDSHEARKEAKTALNYARWSLLLARDSGR
jgi:hypothetical protein